MLDNVILNTDSYKASHFLQYPPGLSTISSYIESRGGAYPQLVFFGLQAFLKAYLCQPITQAQIDEAQAVLTAHGEPFNRAGWQYILEQHNGALPLQIEAVLEGSVIPTQNVLLQVRNTDPECFWLPNYIETALLRAIWYPTTVATTSWHVKQIIRSFLQETADNLDGLPFKLHDFGARGASSQETAALGGMAHLVNFQGTDTVAGLLAARAYYNEAMAGYSIPAAEHSTITCWGKDNEAQAYENMLKQFAGPNKIVAVVSDSYDLWHAIDVIWGQTLKDQVTDNGGLIVIRPDSGDPIDVSCKLINELLNKFGYVTNTKGYRLLPDYLRVIQGDGVSPQTIKDILSAMREQGLSADNIAFGMGGGLLQKINRDTLQFAMKASAAQINGHWQEVYKDPTTDHTKRSKAGRLALIREADQYVTVKEQQRNGRTNYLVPVFQDGKLLVDHNFSDIRDRADS